MHREVVPESQPVITSRCSCSQARKLRSTHKFNRLEDLSGQKALSLFYFKLVIYISKMLSEMYVYRTFGSVWSESELWGTGSQKQELTKISVTFCIFYPKCVCFPFWFLWYLMPLVTKPTVSDFAITPTHSSNAPKLVLGCLHTESES